MTKDGEDFFLNVIYGVDKCIWEEKLTGWA